MVQCNFQVRIKFLPLNNPATAQEKSNLEIKYICLYVYIDIHTHIFIYIISFGGL